MTTRTPRQIRATKRAKLERLASRLETVTREAERARDAAQRKRDEALVEAHGEKRTGGLSYDELAAATGLSKGRVIQIVQGKSAYSQAMREERRGRHA